MAVTPDEVRRVAALAQLELAEDEVDGIVRDLGEIIGHMDALEGVEGPEGRDRGEDRSHLRGDEQGSDPLADAPESFAPGFDGGHFTVPRLESHGGSEAG